MKADVLKSWGRGVLAVAIALLCLPAVANASMHWSGGFARNTAGNGPPLTAIACVPPSGATCVAFDQNGGLVTFASASPAPSVATALLPSTPTDATCPAFNRCVAIDVAGNEVTFDPAAPAGAKWVAIDPGQAPLSLSCVSPSQCIAVDYGGHEVTFDPGSPGGAMVHAIDADPTHHLLAVSCPGFVSDDALCMALDTDGSARTFDGTTGHQTGSQGIESSPNVTLTDISCPTLTECLAFDNAGGEFILNPSMGSSGLTTTTVDSGHSVIDSFCLSGSQCIVLDDAGQELTFTPASSASNLTAVINPAKTNLALACATTTLCFATETTGHVIGFNPQNKTVLGASLVDGGGSYSAVACALPSQCTTTDQSGDVITFDPASRTILASGNVDSSGVTLFSIACPAATQCTAVDEKGQEVTFNPRAPRSPTAPTPVAIVKNHPLLAISCPSTTQCTAVDDDQYAVTFNPQHPDKGIYALLGTAAEVDITGIACPSLTQCTAVDGDTPGHEVTFNPQFPRHPKPFALLPDGAIDVKCPTTTECVALGSGGERSTFAPGAPQTATRAPIDLAQPTALSCPSATRCLATDLANHVVEFDPGGAGLAAVSTPPTAGALTAIACTSAGACAVVDSTGVTFAGNETLPAAPGAAGAPRITGRFLQGRKLTAVAGKWTNTPTSLYPRWARCSSTGTGCRDITGATHTTYTLTAADAGHTLKVRENAANAGGFGAMQTSSRTPMIVGLPGPPAVLKPVLIGTPGAHPRFALDLHASRWGPAVKSVTISLPSGASAIFPRNHVGVYRTLSGLVITAGGRSVGHSERPVSGGLTIALARPVASLHISLSRPLLTIAARLAHAVATHRTRTLAFRLHIVGANGRSWTLRASLPVS